MQLVSHFFLLKTLLGEADVLMDVGCPFSNHVNYFILRIRNLNLILPKHLSSLSKMFAFQSARVTLFGTDTLFF